MPECPLCTILDRETPLYEDDLVYLISTKKMKGHDYRVMCVVKRHTTSPSFEELSRAYAVTIDYMNRVMNGREWLLVDNTFASIKNHKHLIASDTKGAPEELILLEKTPTITMPIETMSAKRHKIVVGIPAYLEEASVGKIVAQSRKYCDVVVVVSDGSPDNTVLEARKAGADVLAYEVNLGVGVAVRKMIDYVREKYDPEVFVMLDADGQHNPEEIPKFVEAVRRGGDLVIGNRFMRESKENIPFHRSMIIKILNKLYNVGDSQCGFRGFSRRALKEIKLRSKRMGWSLDVISQAQERGLTISEVPCWVGYEGLNSHKWNFVSHGMMLFRTVFWDVIWKKPLWIFGFPSLICFSLGMVFSFWLLVEYSRTHWFPLSLAFLSLGGLMGGILFGISTLFVLIGKRLIEELK